MMPIHHLFGLHQRSMESDFPINIILGHGRSGTTWLGSIINSHPGVAYRFEPFHRLAEYDPSINAIFKKINGDEISPEDLAQLYKKLIVADPLTLKPPFFDKSYIPQKGIEKLWLFSRVFRPSKFLYSKFYTPQINPPLVIKDVGHEKHMKNMLTKTDIPLVYLVRHPCGNIMSNLKGQKDGKMTRERNQSLSRFMQTYAPDLFEHHGSNIDKMSVLEIIAWFWRICLDLGVQAIQESGRGKILTYEQLCNAPGTHAEEILNYFGLNYAKETEKFIEGLYFEGENQSGLRQKDLMNGYFTVYRNPSKQKDSWKAKISPEDRKSIEEIVKDSPAFEYCAALGQWD